jgi:hypothetical protein
MHRELENADVVTIGTALSTNRIGAVGLFMFVTVLTLGIRKGLSNAQNVVAVQATIQVALWQ